MTKRTTYFELEQEASMTQAQRETEYMVQGAGANLDMTIASLGVLVELNDVIPMSFVRQQSGSPINIP